MVSAPEGRVDAQLPLGFPCVLALCCDRPRQGRCRRCWDEVIEAKPVQVPEIALWGEVASIARVARCACLGAC